MIEGDSSSETARPLSRASTLPSRFYLDTGVLDAEKERIFGRTWQLVARADELARIGDFVPVTVLDEPDSARDTASRDSPARRPRSACRHPRCDRRARSAAGMLVRTLAP